MRADPAAQAVTVLLDDVLGHLQGQSMARRGSDDRARQHVRGHLVQRRGQPEQFVGVHPCSSGDHIRERRPPLGQGAGLVEQHHSPSSKSLQRPAALDDHPDTGRPRQPGDECDGGGEEQRAWRRDHEHGDRADRVAAECPRPAGQEQGQRDEKHGKAVGDANERGRLRLRLFHEAYQARVGRLGGDCGGDEVEGGSCVDDTAADVVTDRSLDGERLPGQSGLIQEGVVQEPTIDGNERSRAHQQAVASHDVLHRHLHDPGHHSAQGGARGPLEQQAELAPGPCLCSRLKKPTRGQHHGDHGAGEGLVDRQRAGQGQHSDHVDRQLMASDCPCSPGDRRPKTKDRPGRPAQGRGVRRAEQPRATTADQQQGRCDEEQHVLASAQALHPLMLTATGQARPGRKSSVEVPRGWRVSTRRPVNLVSRSRGTKGPGADGPPACSIVPALRPWTQSGHAGGKRSFSSFDTLKGLSTVEVSASCREES